MSTSAVEISAEFTLTEGGTWYSTGLSIEQYMAVLRTGSLPDGKMIYAIKLFDFPDGDAFLIYDFVLARKGVNPWRHTVVNV